MGRTGRRPCRLSRPCRLAVAGVGTTVLGALIVGWLPSRYPTPSVEAAPTAPAASLPATLPARGRAGWDDGGGGGGGCQPGEVLDLDSWKLTLPTGSGGSPTEILPVRLGSHTDSRYFQTTRDCDGVVFRAPVTGSTTKGSRYPRSELREMAGGDAKAGWSATDGTHWMAVTEAFTALPEGKPELVGAQVHDDADDVSVFRLEGSKLYVTNGDNPHYQLIDDNYQLGTVFDAAFLVTEGWVGAYYNGELVAAIPGSFSGAYFKAGAYTQANCSNSPCHDDNFGETVIYALDVGHD